MGETAELGKFIVLTDAYGNRYTYAQLGEVSEVHPVPKEKALTAKDFEIVGNGKADARPGSAASAGANDSEPEREAGRRAKAAAPVNTEEIRERLFALPERPSNVESRRRHRPAQQPARRARAGLRDLQELLLERLQVRRRDDGAARAARSAPRSPAAPSSAASAQVGAGAPHVHFEIQPAGRGAPRIDPKPILDGWKLLETTAIYRAAGKDPFGSEATIGQILLMSKEVLAQRVLADPRIEIYSCGRTDIESGQIDRRILATLEYLAERGYRLTLTSLKCGHSFYTTSGNVRAHSSGNAVDIAQVNGLPILGNQGPGSITEAVVRDLLKLQGTMRPAQIITLMEFGGPTFAMGDHDDHIHVGYTPIYGSGKPFDQLAQVLKPDQWERLINRLGEIENPEVPGQALRRLAAGRQARDPDARRDRARQRSPPRRVARRPAAASWGSASWGCDDPDPVRPARVRRPHRAPRGALPGARRGRRPGADRAGLRGAEAAGAAAAAIAAGRPRRGRVGPGQPRHGGAGRALRGQGRGRALAGGDRRRRRATQRRGPRGDGAA